MAGRIFGTAGVGNSQAPAVAGFKVQTAVYGLPIPIVYGQARVAGNLVHFTDAKATPQLSQGSRSKLVKVDQQVTGYLYQAAVAIALSEGPIVGIGKVWRDKDAGVVFSVYQTAGWSLFLGTATQSPWSYLTSNHPSEAVPYQLTAYVAHPLLDLPNDVLSNYTWEVQGLAQFGSGIVDANPGAVLSDALTNADHGAGFPSARLGDLTAFTQYCTAASLFLSPVLNSQSALADQLAALVEAANSAFVWSDGKLKVLPYADQAITGNGQTYTPNATPIYDLSDNDFLAPEGTDPVVIVRKKPSECFNQLTVEYEDRAHDYNPNVQEFKDQASIDANGLRPAPSLRFPAIKDAATARYVAQLKGQRELSVLNTYQFTLPLRYALLEPMDLVTLTDAGLGLNKAAVRITEVVETETGELQMTAEDFPAGIASASRYGAPAASGTASANNVAPGATTAPVIVEGPGPLIAGALEIWLAASGGANWGGCDVHLSTDNVSYQKVGSITRKGNYGVLTAALATAPASPPNDTTHTLAVDLTSTGGSLAGGSASDLAALLTLCLVESEFVAYQGATLTAANKYNLTTLARGLFGSTIPASHAIGASFLRCDGALLKLPFPQGTNGQVVYFKFPAFNVYGLALEDVASVTAYAHTIGKNTVTTGGAGIVNPPIAAIAHVSGVAATETLQLSAQLGAGAIGALSWSYQIGTATPVTGTGGFPFNITVTRDHWADMPVVLTVTQSDGQSISTAPYLVAARFDGIDPTSGKVDKSQPYASGEQQAGTRDTSHAAGGGYQRKLEDDGRSGDGGLPTAGGRINTDPYYDASGGTPLIDPLLKKLRPGLAMPNGTATDIAERGANKGDAAIDAGNVVVAAGLDVSRAYTNKHLGNMPDDATSDRRAATANQKTGGDRGFGAIDAGNVVVAGGLDLARGYTNKHLGNVPDDATSDRRAATATEKTGGARGAVALDSTNKLITGVTAAATAADGVAGIESTKGANVKGARQGGQTGGRMTDDLVRSGTGGVPTPGGRSIAMPIMDATNATPLIDPVTKTIQPGLAIGAGVRGAADVAFGNTVKYAPNRHTEQKTGVSGDSPTYGVSFDLSPKLTVTPLKYTAPTAGNVAEFSATGGVGGCTLRCVQTSGATSTARTDSFASSLNGTPAGGILIQNNGAAAYCNLVNADGSAITYQVNFDIDTTNVDPSNTVYVQIYTNRGTADNTNWDLVASASYGAGVSATGQYLQFTAPSSGVSVVNANYDVRIVVSYQTAPSAPKRASVTCNTVTYATIAGGTTTPLTGFTGAAVQVQAVEAA